MGSNFAITGSDPCNRAPWLGPLSLSPSQEISSQAEGELKTGSIIFWTLNGSWYLQDARQAMITWHKRHTPWIFQGGGRGLSLLPSPFPSPNRMGNLRFPTKHVQEKAFPQQHKASKVNNSMASPWLQHGPLATAPTSRRQMPGVGLSSKHSTASSINASCHSSDASKTWTFVPSGPKETCETREIRGRSGGAPGTPYGSPWHPRPPEVGEVN